MFRLLVLINCVTSPFRNIQPLYSLQHEHVNLSRTFKSSLYLFHLSPQSSTETEIQAARFAVPWLALRAVGGGNVHLCSPTSTSMWGVRALWTPWPCWQSRLETPEWKKRKSAALKSSSARHLGLLSAKWRVLSTWISYSDRERKCGRCQGKDKRSGWSH